MKPCPLCRKRTTIAKAIRCGECKGIGWKEDAEGKRTIKCRTCRNGYYVLLIACDRCKGLGFIH